jgi:aryl carrier-like protein
LLDVLKVEKVGVNDNLFELGGNSVHLVQVHNRLRDDFNKDIPIVEMFKNPTVSSLTKYLSQGQTDHLSVEQSQQRAGMRRELKTRRMQARHTTAKQAQREGSQDA